MDTCTLITVTTLLLPSCQTEQSCGMTIDGSKKICMSYCRPLPQSYNCVRPDDTTYVWTPQPGQDTIITQDLKGDAR
jgi:hypothetical protein